MNAAHIQTPAMILAIHLSLLGCAAGVDSTDSEVIDEGSLVQQATSPLEMDSKTEACIPECAGRKCGVDPVCGSSCGTCGVGETCDFAIGQCRTACVPDCSRQNCGIDPVCGVSCGTCTGGQTCNLSTGQCQTTCTPDCSGRICGPDPVCGSNCGTCESGQSCDDSSGQCQAACVPDCSKRNCGIDPNCGTSCGTCEGGYACNTNGQCVGMHPPLAVISPPKVGVCDAISGTSTMLLDGTKSSDIDGEPLEYIWTEGTNRVASTSIASVALGAGTHTLTLTVRDVTGLTGTAAVTVNVATSAPIFTSKLTPISLSVCSTDAPTTLPIPVAVDRCARNAVTVTGEVVSKNGAKTSLAVVAGTVTLPAGTSTIRWTAQADGLSTTTDQFVTLNEKSGLVASRKLELADGATVVRPSGTYATVANSGTGSTSVGVEARLGNILSVAPVTLRDRVQVFGSVTTSSTLTKYNNVWIRDATFERNSFVAPSIPSTPSTIPTSSTDVIIQPDRVKSIVPGTYRSVNVASRSTLHLTTGTYYFESIVLEPQATLYIDGSGKVQLFVRSNVTFRGNIYSPKNESDRVQINYLGTNSVYIEAPFLGELVAPNGSVTLRAVSSPHIGAFYAKDIYVDAHAMVTLRPSGCF